VLLQNNAISGPIPGTIGKLGMLKTLDMSDNQLTGSIPSSLGNLKNLNYLKLNNNSLSGVLPDSLASIDGFALVDLSFNNLSGPLPKISARTFIIAGNPMICGNKSGGNCSSVSLDPLSYPPDDLKTTTRHWKESSYCYNMWSNCWFSSFCRCCSWYASLVAS